MARINLYDVLTSSQLNGNDKVVLYTTNTNRVTEGIFSATIDDLKSILTAPPSGNTFPVSPINMTFFSLLQNQRIPDTASGDTFNIGLYFRRNAKWNPVDTTVTRSSTGGGTNPPATTYTMTFGIATTIDGAIASPQTSEFEIGQSKTITKPPNLNDQFFVIELPVGRTLSSAHLASFTGIEIIQVFIRNAQRWTYTLDQAPNQDFILEVS